MKGLKGFKGKNSLFQSMQKIQIEGLEDAYINDYLISIQTAKTEEEIRQLINKIYEDGFQDGEGAE
jgi:hypothetical protein